MGIVGDVRLWHEANLTLAAGDFRYREESER
jgi:hypothetical protein